MILLLVFGISSVFGCDKTRVNSDYSALSILYKAEGVDDRMLVYGNEINFGQDCSHEFMNDPELFKRCVEFFGKSCFVTVDAPPDISRIFCPQGCGGRCLIGVLKKVPSATR